MLNMALLLRVVNESENVVVNQVVEDVNPPVEVGFDICGTSPEPDFSDNQGNTQSYLVFYKFISILLLNTVLSD